MTIPRVCGEGTFSPETLASFTFSRYSSLPQHCHIHTIIYHHIYRWWCEQPCCTFAGYHIPQFHLVAAFNCLALPLSASSVRYQTQYTAADPSRPVNISSQVFGCIQSHTCSRFYLSPDQLISYKDCSIFPFCPPLPLRPDSFPVWRTLKPQQHDSRS